MLRPLSFAPRRLLSLCAMLTLALAIGCSAQSPFPYSASTPTTELPPGTVRVEAVVEACTTPAEGEYQCRLEAKRVILYGRGGRVTPPDTPLDVTFSAERLGLERAPEVGARLDVLVERAEPLGPSDALRASRLYSYTSPVR